MSQKKNKINKPTKTHHGKHHVKTHCWIDGVLQTIGRECRSFEHAMEHLEEIFLDVLEGDIHACKIYSEFGELLWAFNHIFDEDDCVTHY